MMRLEGKVAVISGAASGMGRAGAILFAKEGAKVVILDINQEQGDQVVEEIKRNDGESQFYKTDLLDLDALKQVMNIIDEQYGKIDILWNHVGSPGPSGIENVEEKDYDFTMGLNVKSGFFTTKYALPSMRKADKGSIIFTSSVSGLVASPYGVVYSTAKGAVVNMVRSLAVNLSKDKIRVNGICPGLTETPMMEQFLTRSPDDNLEKNKEYILSRYPLGRFAIADDIANAALFLASDESDFISGVNLPVDGGYTA
ncbi:SDR family NAD(P)-dependent oxidoreductase [Psychrobacillus sp. OK032]|uniref:SDR family NAD(P)-dependent oxidoreductase n=1 Tax=Psychrobacillus sp. OK032 TaxID=1884358 RepID=UPI0008D8714A|nr:SDR family oxidoreductase [Psychrobacillus sp. OK032]SER82361.1 NAD(P)-dependent dehydrogenase, short-chain alcohol dehydrogenase family [Psychrobacillus sp. OK032]